MQFLFDTDQAREIQEGSTLLGKRLKKKMISKESDYAEMSKYQSTLNKLY